MGRGTNIGTQWFVSFQEEDIEAYGEPGTVGARKLQFEHACGSTADPQRVGSWGQAGIQH